MASDRFRSLVLGCLPAAFLASPALASEGGGASLMQPQVGTIFWTIVTFIILAVLLRMLAWKPLLGALDNRRRSIEGSLEEARKEREEASELLEQHKKLVAQAHRERADAIEAGQRDAERLKAEILEQAKQQREQVLQQTEEQVQAGIRHARDDLRALTADLAIQAAEKLLAKTLDDDTHRKLVEEYLADLERSSADSTAVQR